MTATLKRSLSFGLVTFYGLGTILGAGIYVLIGAVAAAAGPWTPLAFLLAAVIAAVTALSYAELVRRMPLCAAEANYVDAAFGRPVFTLTIGLAVVLAGIVSSATIANGFAAYLGVFVEVPRSVALTALVLTLTVIAAVGIEASVWAASAMTVIELAGLLLVIAVAGGDMFAPATLSALLPPADSGALSGVAGGAFLAFYAFLGFEDMVNIAEEVRDVERVMPRAIVTALLIATVLYVLVALTAVSAVPLGALAGSEAPLAVIIAAHGLDARVIAAISVVAVVNGALVQVIKSARVLYGLARERRLPHVLAAVNARTRTPLAATLAVGAAVLGFALSLELVPLAALTSLVTLAIFAVVNLALLVLERRARAARGRAGYPYWLPLLGFVLSLALIAVEFLGGPHGS
ncbi:MAG: amino acid permease [Gammaproteobacteria bacterium]